MTNTKVDFIKHLQKNDPALYEELTAYIKDHSIHETALYMAPKLEEDPIKFEYKLKYYNDKYDLQGLKAQKKQLQKAESTEKELTAEELLFLDKMERGEVSFEQMQRRVALMVFKKLLTNPDKHINANHWLKSELIKIKREELSLKQAEMEMNWVRFFGGFMPPRNCPQCGHEIPVVGAVPLQTDELKIIEGDIDDTKSMGVTASIQPATA